MPSTRDIRRRIKSVKNTAQITKAMQMVAASKMRRAQQSAIAGRPYALLMNNVLAEVLHHVGDFSHPLMEVREVQKTAVILVSTDKGLCGGLNSNLMREVSKLDKSAYLFIAAGRKGSQFVVRTKRELAADFTYRDAPLFSEARVISKFAQDLFLRGEVQRVQVEIKGVSAGYEGESLTQDLVRSGTEFLFEPSAEVVMGSLLPHYLNFQVYQMLLEAKASEHSARMVAMKSATDNAKQLIKDLTLEYNKMRQASITNELLEISSAAMAVS
jgi:F-type H+-transporting ATPase subunit gamma